jgi:hypothetical protein
MLEWEMALEALRGQGWNYGYGKCHDPQTGTETYLVILGRGDEKLSICHPSIEHAVVAITSLAQKKHNVNEKLLS